MKKTWIMVVVALALVLSSCNFPFTQVSDLTLATSVAQTVEALESEVKVPELTIPTFIPTLAVPTAAPVATMTAVPTIEPDPCLYATYVSETISDHTVFGVNDPFTKSWTLRNTGTCVWNTGYRISYMGCGDQMSPYDHVHISKETDPGECIKIDVPMIAPAVVGTYSGCWQMETNHGVKFGKVWVEIDVE